MRTLLCPGDIITYTLEHANTSVLTIPTPQYFNGTTVICRDGTTNALIGSDKLNIPLAPPPSAPTIISLISTNADQLTVTWTSVPTATSYNVRINDTLVPIPSSGALQYTFTGLMTHNMAYTVSVVAINCAGSSSPATKTANIEFLYPPLPLDRQQAMLKRTQLRCLQPPSTTPIPGRAPTTRSRPYRMMKTLGSTDATGTGSIPVTSTLGGSHEPPEPDEPRDIALDHASTFHSTLSAPKASDSAADRATTRQGKTCWFGVYQPTLSVQAAADHPFLVKVPQLSQELPLPAASLTVAKLQLARRSATASMREAFEHELSHHPDKTWVLLGINTGYKGSCYRYQARNLASALVHSEAVDVELKNEVDAGRVLGPFPHHPQEHLRTSDLGEVPNKNGKWRAILHLSAPEGRSINDYINREEFSLRYSTIDDAMAHLGKSWACRLPLRSQKGQLHLTSLTYLGIMLDYSNYGCPQPSCKKSPFSPNLGWRSVTKRELLSRIGKLSFAAKAVPAGRLFLRHLIHLSTTARRLHHRLRLNVNARADVEWWDHFLPFWNGLAMFIAPDCHPPLHGCFKYTGVEEVDGATSLVFGLAPLPGSKHTVTLFATYLNKTLQANTFRVYMAAVSHLHLTHGLSSDNPTLSLAIQGIQCSQDPAHLWPMQLPLTNAILEQRLGLLDSDLLETHDRLIVKAPLTREFFRFLRVNEFTTQGRGTFDPRIHPTRQGPKMVSSSSKSQRLTKHDSSSPLVPDRFSSEGQPLHDYVMVVEHLVASKGSQHYLGPKHGLMDTLSSDCRLTPIWPNCYCLN
eukprot:Em0005g407a